MIIDSQNYSHTFTHAHLHMLEYDQLYLQVCREMFDAVQMLEKLQWIVY